MTEKSSGSSIGPREFDQRENQDDDLGDADQGKDILGGDGQRKKTESGGGHDGYKTSSEVADG